MAGANAVKIQTLRCSHCGAPQEVRGGPRSRVLVCAYCDSAIDLTDPNFSILWRYEQQAKYKPLIKLGTRGRLLDEEFECIGFMRRSTDVEGVPYGWSEYLLYNPYKGYRWLVEEDGQWSIVRESMALPTYMHGEPIATQAPGDSVKYMGRVYKRFQTSVGRVDYALGEFYWRVSVGQETTNTDFVCPPYILSAEIGAREITWSSGQYLPSDEVWHAFKITEPMVRHAGVAADQPNPIGPARDYWTSYFIYVMLALFITLGFSMAAKRDLVFRKSYSYYVNQKERAYVTDYFTVSGSPANLEVTAESSGALDNRWAFYRLTLINNDTNTALDFGIENSYYHGVDGGESWSEGNRTRSVTLPHVAAGNYYFRIEPESGTGEGPERYDPNAPDPGRELFVYAISARRDVTQWSLFWWSTLFLLPIPLIQSVRSWSFESRRWAKSGK